MGIIKDNPTINKPVNTRNTTVRVRGVRRCVKIRHRTRTCITRLGNTAALPVPMLHPSHQHDLSQVWAYMWNCWYNLQQWPLWAHSVCPEIPRLKATMICKSTWCVIKHQDLALFNHPQLDLVTHVIIKHLIPRSSYNLATILGQHCQGHGLSLAEWQKDFRSAWKDMSWFSWWWRSSSGCISLKRQKVTPNG